ncbi:MAG TPA: N-acetylmuramoyl-L-alanine amidase [Clostridia bacterium]
MIVVMKKNSLILGGLFLLLCVVLFSINIGNIGASPASTTPDAIKTILLDPGHGGEDPGAVSDYSGLKEKDVNLSIATNLKQLLEKENYKVLMTREEDKLEYSSETRNIVRKRSEDLHRRKKMMDECGADIVVSVHLNKFPQTQYSGAQTFFPAQSPESQKLAGFIQSSIKESVDPSNKREALLKKEPIIILKDSKTTTVIVECGFLSNQEEEKNLQNPEYQGKLAVAIKDGIVKYFKGKP